jgi:hypothetical protein
MAIPALISAGGAIAGGLLGKGKNANQTTQTTTANYTPEQQQIMQMLAKMFNKQINPEKRQKNEQRWRNQAFGTVNKTYDALGDRLKSSFAGRGFSGSGKEGEGILDLNIARANDIQNAESDVQQNSDQQLLQMLGLANSFARPTGQTTTTQYPQQSPWAGIISGGANSVATSLWLKNLLGQGAGGASTGLYSGDDMGFPGEGSSPWESYG